MYKIAHKAGQFIDGNKTRFFVDLPHSNLYHRDYVNCFRRCIELHVYIYMVNLVKQSMQIVAIKTYNKKRGKVDRMEPNQFFPSFSYNESNLFHKQAICA